MNDTMLLAADSATPFIVPEATAQMKQCPVCQARVFDDMHTCFNCMYQFGSNPALEQKAAQEARGVLDGQMGSGKSADEAGGKALQAEGAADLDSSKDAQAGTKKQGGGFCFPRASFEEQTEAPLCPGAGAEAGETLLAEALVELHRFLGQFLLHRGIDIKEL